MATVAPQPEHTYEIRVDQLEVTRGPTINHPGDRERKFASGPIHYYVDDVEVDEQTWNAEIADAGISFND